MTDKSTSEVRMISAEVVKGQARVCEVQRAAMDDRLDQLTETVKANATAIAALTTNMATMTATVTPMCATVKEHASAIEKLKGRPAVWAAIGASIPVLLTVLLWWLTNGKVL